MKKIALAASIVLVPALAHAQSSANVHSDTRAAVTAQGSANGHHAALSADADAKVNANLKAARARHLPEQPIRDRVAEGEAKGASEAQIVAASGHALADLQASYDAMVKAGRKSPSDAEVARGAQLMARGFTSAQVEAMARRDAVARDAGSARGAGAANVAGSAAGVAGSAAAGAGVAATGALSRGTAGVAGSATGALGGAIKRP